MLPGFNHNLRHRDQVFHVQTEDGGLGDPQVVTQLFIGGRCLAVRRWSYAAEMPSPALTTRVRERMMAMHKGMLKAVTAGEFDAPGDATAPTALAPAKAEAPPRPGPRSPEPPTLRSVPRSEAPTLETPVVALEERSAASATPRADRRQSAFAPATLSDDELLAEIDAELRRREPSSIRRAPAEAGAPKPQSSPRRRVPAAAPTLVEHGPPRRLRREDPRREPSSITAPAAGRRAPLLRKSN